MTESRGERMMAAIRPALHSIPAAPRNPIQEGLDNYHAMEVRLQNVEQANVNLRVENGALVAEVNMLREALNRSEDERVQKAAIAGTFVAQVRSLNAIMVDMMKNAQANGIEAIEKRHPEETERADADAAAARGIIERVEPSHATPKPAAVPY